MKRFLKYDTEIVKKENSPVDKNGLIKENIVGGGSSVQPDWNQNDSTQPDYIKNRPFYVGNPVETVLVEESTVSFSDAGGVYMAQFQSTFSATVGETYKVYWDGSNYECTCVDFNGHHAIGNLSIVGAGSDTGEPFVMDILNGEGIQIVTADTSASHTFSICVFAPEVVKIDPKYIRDMYYTGDPVETVLLEETTATFTEKDGLYEAEISADFSLEIGTTYKVSWDGTIYECVGIDLGGNGSIVALGNLSIINEGEDTGEPFVYGAGRIITADTSASHTISISGLVVPITKIDEKYLPDSIISDISTAQSTANTAKSTANTAQSTANTAKSTADAAKSTADAAKSTADAAKSTADAAKSTADAAKSTADGCVKINNSGGFIINLDDNSYFSGSNSSGKSYYCLHQKDVTDTPIVLSIGTDGGSALTISVTPSTSPTVKITPPTYLNKLADIEIGGYEGHPRPQITGLGGITMCSSTAHSTKKFRITVDDSGAITATEVS